MRWSPQQDAALAAVADWIKRPRAQIFRLFGYAGTGKTTLARHLAEDIDGDVVFGAYTGKAALVMRGKGCVGASTIHAMIYRPRGGDEEGPSFALNRSGAAAEADLIVIDECSMVDEELGRDLMSFGKKVLVLGDPAQLPPVKGGGFFTDAEPDAMLTEVHRQAADDPIIRMSLDVREGRELARGQYGESRVVSRRDIATEEVTAADQVLVGTNRTRRLYNGRLRELKGLIDPMPAAGDKLVCLRNDKTKGLFNGGTWTVQRLKGSDATRVKMDLLPDEEGARRSVSVSVLKSFFEGDVEQIPFAQRRRSDEFDYGYALTVHKAQGSQWDDVMLFDESYAFRENSARWLYTGLTRAAKKITVVR
ncbi:ATP-dependent RecD-like DNA helicase [Methylopila sp. M107]|uniref:ATP-dependent DNA helicase n=1 Tax=Methylopila sp. M107 TaxID=1101190 RepID=UPI00036128D6|nr:ATP-dependent RecD-like DNA helicase [Methylopila sp. M107]